MLRDEGEIPVAYCVFKKGVYTLRSNFGYTLFKDVRVTL